MQIGVAPLESTLVVANDRQEAYRFPIDAAFEQVVVGRGQLNKASVRNPAISSRHCMLTYNQAEGLVIEDLGSSSGTWLNGHHINREAMQIGDLATIGPRFRGVQIYIEHTVADRRPAPGSPSELSVEPLLQTILDEPRDDDARLVYADWLDQRGDPQAGLIRYQIAVESMPASDRRRHDLEMRIRDLLRIHEARWIAPLPVPVVSWTFRRGFLDEVRVGAPDAIADVMAALQPHHPIQRVHALL